MSTEKPNKPPRYIVVKCDDGDTFGGVERMPNQATEPRPTRFEAGRRYETRSACDSNCVWIFEIVSRTKKMVKVQQLHPRTLQPDGEVFARHVRTWRSDEEFKPFGSYSMAPIVRSDRLSRAEARRIRDEYKRTHQP